MEHGSRLMDSKSQKRSKKLDAAHDWVNNTGQGVKENETKETFEDLVRQRCKWYFELAPIMGDRSKARPKVTTDLLDNELSSLDGSEDDDSLTEKEANKSVVTSVASFPISARKKRSGTSSSSVASSAKKTRNRGPQTLKDTKPDFMEEYLRAKQITKTADLNERERHNKRMEEIEESKNKWKSKMEELEYKKQLMKTKRDLEEQGFDKDEIIAMIPDLEIIYNTN
eukprot:scaffold5140_cov212-Amphora_coffeaeformis.AAC.2